MAFPRNVKLSVDYDGTRKETVTVTSTTTGGSASYTVKSGDTLWAISKKYLGKGTRYPEIYNANKDQIEATARKHRKKSSDNGHWIWPGEVFTIPGQTTTSTHTEVRRVGTSNPGLGKLIGKSATAFSYTDVATGSSDSMSLTIYDCDKKWLGAYHPQKGSSFGVSIAIYNWNSEGNNQNFKCGEFTLDDISFSGWPLSCVLSGVSVPVNNDFKVTQKKKTWKSTSVRSIASQIAQQAGVSLVYDASDISVDELEQSNQTDSDFLSSLCSKYGFGMKIYSSKIVITDPVKSEEKGTVATISDREMEDLNVTESIDGTYTGANISYTNPDKKDPINVTVGTAGRMLSMDVQSNSQYDAELQAAAKVNESNRKALTMTFTLMGYRNIVATQCIQISGLGFYDGKYHVDSVKHSVGSGYKTSYTAHKVQPAIKVTAPAPAAPSGRTYTVKSGDTLWGIAKKYYGKGTEYEKIYNANRDQIEATARKHRKKSSDHGHWIWSGEVFTIP